MTDKDLSKIIVSNYHSTIIPLCRLLKAHATNIMLLPNDLILMQPIINGVRNYMILNRCKEGYSNFINGFISLPDISKINTKFRKTKSEISWGVSEGTNYFTIKNPEQDPCNVPLINNPTAIEDIMNVTYKNIPEWDISRFSDFLCDESSSMYTALPDSFINDMIDKKLCEISVCGESILLSRPFLGDLKKTTYVGYRVISKLDDKIILKFKQSEELGDIYTYAAFLIV